MGVILSLLLLGWGLQLDAKAKANTYVKLLDLLINLVVIVWAASETVLRKNDIFTLFLTVLATRAFVNVYPFIKTVGGSLLKPASEEAVEETCLDMRNYYSIDRRRCVREETPCIYIANHGLWSLDDVSALGALSSSDLLVVVNIGPSGIRSIPRGCRKHLCTIDRVPGERGSGFESLRSIMLEQVIRGKKSLLIFVEDMGRKTEDVNSVAPFHTGTFALAKELNIRIVPMWISWPCQFPTLLNPTNKVLRILEGPMINPENFESPESLKLTTRRALISLSKHT